MFNNDVRFSLTNFEGIPNDKETPFEFYGWNDCKYIEIKLFTKSPKNKIVNHVNSTVNSKQLWKTALTNIVLENVLRKRREEKIIPIIFITDREISSDLENSYLKNLTTPKNVASKTSCRITEAEMRRAYKLCCEMGDSELDKEIMRIANETLVFAKISQKEEGQDLQLENTNPFWKRNGWIEAWNERMGNTDDRQEKIKKKNKEYWKEQAHNALKSYSPRGISIPNDKSADKNKIVKRSKPLKSQNSNENAGSPPANSTSTNRNQNRRENNFFSFFRSIGTGIIRFFLSVFRLFRS